MFIKLLAFSALLSTCLAVTLPKSMLIRLCETAKSARDLGSTKSEVIQAMVSDLKSYIGQSGLSSHHKEKQVVDINENNYGVNQIVSVLNYDPEYMGEWTMGFLNVVSQLVAFRPIASNSSSLTLTIQDSLFKPNLTNVLPEKFYNIFKWPQSVVSVDKNYVSDLVSSAASKVVSSLNSDYCKIIDLPESVDTDNQVDVQKAVLRIISSLLKQYEKATQSIENYLSAVDKQITGSI
uniref:SAP domain-containing protein n=2 Tax=Tetranychus urticae TaxID=32264 RepID=T1KZP5_TETUR